MRGSSTWQVKEVYKLSGIDRIGNRQWEIEAGKCNRGGYLMISDSLPYTSETLSMVTDIPLPTVQLGLGIFVELGMIDQQDGTLFKSLPRCCTI